MSTAEQAQGAAAPVAVTQEANLLDQIVERTKPQDAKERERNRTYVDEFLRKVVQPGQVISKDVETNIKYWITEIDKKLSAQLDEVMHQPEFQKLESTWRGLHYLVDKSETGEGLKLFRDFFDGMLLEKKEIDRERRVIFSEM